MWRVELHCHSEHSRDSDTALLKLIEICEARKIDAIALTDHNEITGAIRLKQLANKRIKVIIGEEIASQEGDVIGLFLKEKIEARLPIEETIRQIRSQGGVVLLPHPFDRIRHEAVGKTVTERIKNVIDFIEIFNSRCLFPGDNRKAKRYAKENSLSPFVGSDAHTKSEYGRSLNIMEPFRTPEEFIQSLKKATFKTRASGPFVHVRTKVVKIRKKNKK